MSDVMRRIITVFEARGSGQVRARLAEMRGGFSGYRQELQRVRYEQSLVDKQMRAFGTTWRYALAGLGTFGTLRGIQQLSEIQQQLGLISAISPSALGGYRLAGEELARFGEQAEDAAFRALTPIQEFNAGLINLVSTVQLGPGRQDEITPILEQIAQTARLTLTPVDEATKGITGMLVSFGMDTNIRNVQKFLAEYQRLIFQVPGGAAAGPQVIQQLPLLASVSRVSNLSPEQMMGLLTTVLRTGGQPATQARGLQYLIQGLGQPPSPQAAKALAGIGITPQFVQEQGGMAALLRLIEEVRKRGVRGNMTTLQGLPEDVLTSLEGMGGRDTLAGLGISGAGAEFAREAVGRIHGVRSLVLLAAQNDQAVEDIRAMVELGQDHAEQVRVLRENWQAFAKEAQLREASMAIDQMAMDVAQAFEPVLNFSSQGLVELRKVVDKHPEAFAYGTIAGIAGLLSARKLGALGKIGPLGAAGAQSLGAMGAEQRQLGDSITNPMFVAVVYSLGNPFRPTTPPGPTSPVPGPGGAPEKTGGRRMGRFNRVARIGAAATVLGAGAMAADEANAALPEKARFNLGGMHLDFGAKVWDKFTGIFRDTHKQPSPQERDVLTRLERGYINTNTARRLLANLERQQQPGGQQMKLKGELEVTVNTPEGKKKQRVPVTLFNDFTQPAPQTRGQDKTYRG